MIENKEKSSSLNEFILDRDEILTQAKLKDEEEDSVRDWIRDLQKKQNS
jgi:hypothetical protein